MIAFITVFITLLIERFFDWSHIRKWSWYATLEKVVALKLTHVSPYMVVVATIVPLVLGLIIVNWLFGHILYGLLYPVLQVVGLLYCYGPRNLWVDAFAAINSSGKGMVTGFNISASHSPQAMQQQVLNQIFVTANERIFGVVFWYVFLGLPGALTYRLVNVATEYSQSTEAVQAAQNIQNVLNWLPVRAFTGLFALAGNFSRVLQNWRRYAVAGVEGNEVMLYECGIAAVTENADHLPPDSSVEKNAVGLLDRVFIIVLVIMLISVFVV